MPPLAGRVAVVTGGTGALGQAVTMRLLADGASVAVPYAVEEERTRLTQRVAAADRQRLILQAADVIDLEAMTAFAESVLAARGTIDILVAGVGGFAGGSLLETDLETWKRMLDLNLTSAFSVAKAVLPAMVRARYGRGAAGTCGSASRTGRCACRAATKASKAAAKKRSAEAKKREKEAEAPVLAPGSKPVARHLPDRPAKPQILLILGRKWLLR